MTFLLWLHLLGAAFWLGGLAIFSFVVPSVFKKSALPELIQYAPSLVRGYLILSWLGVAILFVTGMEMSHSQIPGWMGTSIGRIFLFKVVLFGMMGFMAVYVTMALYPRLNFIALEVASLAQKVQESEVSKRLARVPLLIKKIIFWMRFQLIVGATVLYLAIKMVQG